MRIAFTGLLLLCSWAMAAAPPLPRPGSLVIVGGGGLPASIERRFVQLAGGKGARLVVIPTASQAADEPAEKDSFLSRWRKNQVASVQLLHTRSREVANRPDFIAPLREATGVWLSGGDQSRLTAAYRGTAVHKELSRLLARGGVVGGTSAGAAVMTELMITGGRSQASTGLGFGLLSGVLVDQHFLRRDRVQRLLGALENRPDLIGMGIDEATAAVVSDGKIEVVGDSYVMLIASRDRVRLRVLKPGDRQDLRQFTR